MGFLYCSFNGLHQYRHCLFCLYCPFRGLDQLRHVYSRILLFFFIVMASIHQYQHCLLCFFLYTVPLGASINSGESTYRIQAFYDDCEGTGRRYASLEHRVIVSVKTPLGKGVRSRELKFWQIFENSRRSSEKKELNLV
jgi:hypothetical protein